jgi:hypothetical protein
MRSDAMKRHMSASTIGAMIILTASLAASAWAEPGPGVALPATVQDHLALAASYDEKAAAYRKEVAYHKAMMEEAGKAERMNPKAQVHPRYQAMRKHCKPIIRDAEQLASDMGEFAKWHRMRSGELEDR